MQPTRFFAAFMLVAVGAGHAAPPQSAASPSVHPPTPEAYFATTALPPEAAVGASIAPLKIPGYELRVLDRKKPVRFNVGGVWAESSLPIFIYMPTNDLGLAAGLLRKAHEQLQELTRKPEWTADELQGVLTNLDAASRAIDDGAPPTPSGSAAKAKGSLPPSHLPATPVAPAATLATPAAAVQPSPVPR
jgi:hypothetical protein